MMHWSLSSEKICHKKEKKNINVKTKKRYAQNVKRKLLTNKQISSLKMKKK